MQVPQLVFLPGSSKGESSSLSFPASRSCYHPWCPLASKLVILGQVLTLHLWPSVLSPLSTFKNLVTVLDHLDNLENLPILGQLIRDLNIICSLPSPRPRGLCPSHGFQKQGRGDHWAPTILPMTRGVFLIVENSPNDSQLSYCLLTTYLAFKDTVTPTAKYGANMVAERDT